MASFHPRPRLAALAGLAAAFAAAIAVSAPRPSAQQRPSPTLLVLVVVDQMRADYLTRFDRHFTGGFRRLIDQGAIFERTFYPYLNTVTCAGHATLGTGAWPKTHGIILNEWYRRDLGRVRSCTADAATTPVQYVGTPEKEGHSARELLVPTLAERLRARWPQSRSVSVAVKPRSAVMMAGKGATAVTWVGTDGWQTSTAFADRTGARSGASARAAAVRRGAQRGLDAGSTANPATNTPTPGSASVRPRAGPPSSRTR